MARPTAWLFLVPCALAAIGCDDFTTPPSLSPTCDAGVPIIRFATPLPDRPIERDLTVRGTVEGFGSLAIHRVVVSGVTASNDGFNFDTWSATIPLSTLVAVAEPTEPPGGGPLRNLAELDVYLEDACGARHFQAIEDRRSVEVVDGAGTVRELMVRIEAPSGGFIAANGVVAATVVVEASAPSAGGVVQLTTTRGTFVGAGTSADVVLQRVGERARASTLLTSDMAGDVTVTARAGSLSDSATIVASAPPTISPAGGTLLAGQATAVRITTTGQLDSCVASGSPAFRVTSAGRDLLAGPVSAGMATELDARVEALPTEVDASVTLRCDDVYGQEARATFTIVGVPATPPP